jgi:hypothetical protein
MSALIKVVDSPGLSEILREAHVELTPRESRIMDDCSRQSFMMWAGYNNEGELMCVWGVIPPSVLSDEVYLWLYVTEAVKTNQFLFVRRSQIVIQELLREYRAVVGYVNVDAVSSQRWLKWLGAEFGPAKAGRLPFRIECHGI